MNPYEIDISEPADKKRERLILEQLPQVHLIARRLHDRLPESVCFDDLVSSGVLGLIAAIDNFDQAFGVKLKTYAEHKIRGAILDSLRGIDWASRHRRKKSKNIEAAVATVQQRLQRAPTEDEIATELGLTLDQYHTRLSEIHGLNLESLDVAVGTERQPDDAVADSGRRRKSAVWPAGTLRAGAPARGRNRWASESGEDDSVAVLQGRIDAARDRRHSGHAHLACVRAQDPGDPLRLRVQMRRQWPSDRGR